ncbi:MAG TPA: hypothetical protein VK860_11020 [Ilumatobacteraceae bacterium]|nr:hypothetical protein [Ilumatobacteraceae bacterium]
MTRIPAVLAAAVAAMILSACETNGLVPDVTTDDQDLRPPATDTRTSDPASPSLPIATEP